MFMELKPETVVLTYSADFQVCCIADFQVRLPLALLSAADLEVGDTAGLETCATVI